MELRHLRYFCAVAEHRSFTVAARQLNVSQSGVSGQVRDLEKEIGVTLLHRRKREVALTPEGSAFFHEAREILMRSERAVDMAMRASKGQSGRLTVGLCGPVTASCLPKAIRTFRKQFPGVALSLREHSPAEQVDALLDGRIDMGFTRGIPSEVKHLLYQELLFREPVIVALPKGHPLAQHDAVSVRQLTSERLILFGREGAPEVFDSIVAMCKKARFSPKIADTPSSWHSVLTMVESGEGLGLVPQCVQFLRGNDIVFRPLRDGGARLDAVVFWRRDETSFLQESLLGLLKEKRSEYVGTHGAGITTEKKMK
ncbi:MAG: transcriptional regulator, LysR family [Acidobacteriaceae bacterium]|nr:transcriptional regulator, LysR family [Acidobacteriaceae bacterium]